MRGNGAGKDRVHRDCLKRDPLRQVERKQVFMTLLRPMRLNSAFVCLYGLIAVMPALSQNAPAPQPAGGQQAQNPPQTPAPPAGQQQPQPPPPANGNNPFENVP